MHPLHPKGDATRTGSSPKWVGGLIGLIQDPYSSAKHTIEDCYCSGNSTVGTDPEETGGLIGFCFDVTNTDVLTCFWDGTTSDQTEDICGGTEETTTNMQTKSTFTDVGWNFDSVVPIWGIAPSSYPHLVNTP